MDSEAMIDDLVRMLDSGVEKGVGHVNVEFDEDYDIIRSHPDPGAG